MNTQYTVITDNGGGPNQIYHDIAGEIYTFPPMYRNKLTAGTQVIYHRAKKKRDDENIPNRLSDESHYFGVAEIGSVTPTNDGNLRAEIVNFKQFKYPVMIHRPGGGYYEINPFFQQGARSTTKLVYDAICAASEVKPAPVAPKAPAKKGIRTFTALAEGLKSAAFGKSKYQIVTGKEGYYLKNLADGIYYELGKVKGFHHKDGNLKVLAQKAAPGSSALKYLIRHELYTRTVDIGIIEPITNGLHFDGKIDGHEIKVNILL